MPSVRRLFATLMLALFLLNVLGYYGILQGFKAKSMVEGEAKNEEGLGSTVTFKIPLTVPYGVDSREYEKTEGQFEFGGEIYQLVKQKLQKDTLYLVGVKDETSSMWGRAIADYVMTFSDTDDNSSESTASQTSLIKDFISSTISLTRATAGWDTLVAQHSFATCFVSTFSPSFVHPPERG